MGVPEIFNSDQGSQFTSLAFVDKLEQQHVQISMDGRGRAMDNIFISLRLIYRKIMEVCQI